MKSMGETMANVNKALAADTTMDIDNKRKRTTAKKDKDPYAPKRPQPSYMAYLHEARKIIPEERVKKGLPSLNSAEMSKEVGNRWRSLTDAEKQPWIDLYNKDRERYQRQLEEYKQTGAFHDEPVSDDDGEDGEDDDSNERSKAAKNGKSGSESSSESDSEDEKQATPPSKKSKSSTSGSKKKDTPKNSQTTPKSETKKSSSKKDQKKKR